MKTMLVTGGAGFIGSNFIHLMLHKHPDYQIINIDTLTYAGNLENLKSVQDSPNYKFFKVDIRDRFVVEEIFSFFDIDFVVNFAADNSDERKILEPDVFITTNIVGTQVLLNTAKSHWKLNPDDNNCKEYKKGVRFHQVSTDEVYGSISKKGKLTEKAPLLPNSEYSVSKASADLLVSAYREAYGLPTSISRCSNNYGPYQYPEKLIPLMIIYSEAEKSLPVNRDVLQIRDWLYVEDHCEAIDMILHAGKDGEIYNIGGNNEKTNMEIGKYIINSLGKSEDLLSLLKEHPSKKGAV